MTPVLNPWHIQHAVRVLRQGGIVVHATEGVWGLACDPFDAVAVAHILALKKRHMEKGLILIGACAGTFEPELTGLSGEDRARVAGSWPGPVTWLLPNRRFPHWITGGRSTVAVRVPGHLQARELARRYGGALVSTSANVSGAPAAVSALAARRLFRALRKMAPDTPAYLLPGETLNTGRPSRIRSLTGEVFRA